MSIPFSPDLTGGYALLAGTNSTITSDTDTDSSAIDLQDYEGPVHVLFSIGDAGDANTSITVKLRQSSTSGGTYADITGATSGTLAGSATANDNVRNWFKVDNWSQRFVKTRVTTAGGGTVSVPIHTTVIARRKISAGSGVKTDG